MALGELFFSFYDLFVLTCTKQGFYLAGRYSLLAALTGM